MAKAKKIEIVQTYSVWDVRNVAREAANLVRWNPPLAIKWMDLIADKVVMGSDLVVEEFNWSARKINDHLDQLESMRYYNKKKVWGPLIPTRVEEIDNVGAIPELYQLD